MKKLNFVVLLAALMTVGGRSYAHDIEVPNADGVTIYYNFTNDKTELEVTYQGSSYGNYAGKVVIPQLVTYEDKTYPVTSISMYAFYSCRDLTEVTIPNSVTSIAYGAFGDCSSLTEVTIPNSVTSIAGGAFRDCSSLTEVTIPNSVTSIGDWAFRDCSSLTEVTIPNSVTSIGRSVFEYCSSLTEVTIPNSVTSIGDWAFNFCSGLTEVTIGNSVTSIGHRAFSMCTSLTEVIIPNSVTSIGDEAFYGCDVPEESRGLTSVTIGNNVDSIGAGAFAFCRHMKNLTIPHSVTFIGTYAFQNCNGLTEVTIPRSVTAIGTNPFQSCFGLKNITVENGNPNYDSRENCNAIIQKDGNILISGCRNTQIPNGVEVIGYDAFHGSYLAEITLPNSVTAICGGAFRFCTNLENITVESGNPYFDSREGCNAIIETNSNKLIVGSKNTIIHNSVTAIGDSVFYSYKSLTELTIGNGVTSIGNYAFSFCSGLTKLTIGNSVTFIGNYAFRGCSSLTTLYSLNTTPPSYSNDNFTSDQYATVDVFVPEEALEAYQTAEVWKNFQKLQAISTGVEHISNAAEQIQSVNGQITVTGLTDGTTVAAYDLNGQQIGMATSKGGQVNISTGMTTGAAAIVKMGDKSVKIMMK